MYTWELQLHHEQLGCEYYMEHGWEYVRLGPYSVSELLQYTIGEAFGCLKLRVDGCSMIPQRSQQHR